MLGVAAIGAGSTICNCNNVSKGAICAAIADGGLTTVGQVKAATKAGTGCGSCVPLCTAILHHELEKAGVTIDRSLCEHFPFTRQQLFDIVRVRQVRTFEELISGWGKGRGCEICRPAVGSMLASLWNEYVLDPAHAGLQDTNDRFLANMQKDGSYSIIPRVPGGEITPDKLIALGEVAKEFNLYSKITGAQRIDLFGARLDQLPHIWAKLIDAGFESGHAYGKALRTVKSCVGSTWCRFGQLDSVSLAIEIELRYRGFRAPHKLKSAVSGCARECAEALGQGLRRHRHRDRLERLRLRQRRDAAPARRAPGREHRQGDGHPVPRPVPDVLHPHRRPPGAHRAVVQQARRRDRLPEVGDHRRRPRHLRRPRSRDAAPGRDLPVRVEGHDRRPGQGRPLHPLRQRRRRRRRQPPLRGGAGPEAPGPSRRAGLRHPDRRARDDHRSGPRRAPDERLGRDLPLRRHLPRHRGLRPGRRAAGGGVPPVRRHASTPCRTSTRSPGPTCCRGASSATANGEPKVASPDLQADVQPADGRLLRGPHRPARRVPGPAAQRRGGGVRRPGRRRRSPSSTTRLWTDWGTPGP